MKIALTTQTKNTRGNWRPGTSYKCTCPYCKYKSNTYRTAFNWDKAIIQCEKCQEKFELINMDENTKKVIS